jgi:predicted cupin superfamily sugar epimerase
VELLELHPDGRTEVTVLGPDLAGMSVQHVVPGGTWQGSRLIEGGQWALLGTTMAPGFSPEDFEIGTAALIDMYPSRSELIGALLKIP